MRIDDDNKVVWCSDVNDLDFVDNQHNLATIEQLIGFDGSYASCDLQNDYFDGSAAVKLSLIKAIVDAYEFKIEQKKYYWRKKKEHFASFETRFADYLNVRHHGKNATLLLGDSLTTSVCKTKFTEQEARELLKDDFNMFEKVECE